MSVQTERTAIMTPSHAQSQDDWRYRGFPHLEKWDKMAKECQSSRSIRPMLAASKSRTTAKAGYRPETARLGAAIMSTSLVDEDRTLVQRCLSHEPGAWNDFVDKYVGLFYHVVRYTAYLRSVVL